MTKLNKLFKFLRAYNYPLEEEWYQPYYYWNPFDERNDHWSPMWIQKIMTGFKCVNYSFEAWSYRMQGKYYHPNPEVFWAELNNGWVEMNYENKCKTLTS